MGKNKNNQIEKMSFNNYLTLFYIYMYIQTIGWMEITIKRIIIFLNTNWYSVGVYNPIFSF